MRRLFSKFEESEVYIARGQSVDSFASALSMNNAGIKPTTAPSCRKMPVSFLYEQVSGKMFQAHWEEVAQDKSWPCEINWEQYYLLESLGMVHIVVLFANDTPVGYFIFVTSPALHYRSKTLASSDMFYVMPAYRHYAIRLFRAAEGYAKQAGAHKMYIAFKIYKDIQPLTRRLGFKHVENVVVKSLE